MTLDRCGMSLNRKILSFYLVFLAFQSTAIININKRYVQVTANTNAIWQWFQNQIIGLFFEFFYFLQRNYNTLQHS